MKVFVTGASGFIGSAVVRQLLNGGHTVLGLARSEESAKSITAAGAGVHHGSLEDLDSLRSGAEAADAVIHLGFIHDFSKFAANAEIDRLAIETLGSALSGTNRPLIVSSGIGPREGGRIATEDTDTPFNSHMPRVSEPTALAQISKGVRVSVVRLPQVHNPAKQGLVTMLIRLARDKGISPYIGDGLNRWAAAHVLDVALLYRLVLEKGTSGTRYHAVGEEGVPLKEIAGAIGKVLKVPVVSQSPQEAPAHFGFFAHATGMNMPASSALTQQWLGWHPSGPGLIADMEKGQF